MYNDPIRCVLFAFTPREANDSIASGYIHPTGIGSPVSPAMPGVYDDYGCITLSENLDAASLFVLKTLNIEPDDIHDHFFNNDGDTPPITITMHGHKVEVGYCLMRENLYQFYMTAQDVDPYQWSITPTEMKKNIEGDLLRYIEIADEMHDIKNAQRANMDFSDEQARKYISLVGKIQEARSATSRIQLVGAYNKFDINFRVSTSIIKHQLDSLVINGSRETLAQDLRPFVQALSDLMILTNAMDHLRRSFAPQRVGSQEAMLDLQLSLNNAIQTEIATMKRRWGECDDEEDDEIAVGDETQKTS